MLLSGHFQYYKLNILNKYNCRYIIEQVAYSLLTFSLSPNCLKKLYLTCVWNQFLILLLCTVCPVHHLRYLKLETILYTSMYNVLTLFCKNSEHVTDQMKVI